MIERVYVRFFQCHDRRSVELSPTVTTFVGPSAAGKSALLRALRWLATNRPLGTAMIGRWGKAPYALSGAVIDGVKVRRKRGPKCNEYRIDGKRLKAPKTDVPQAVKDLVNVGPVNFQFQFDAPYWFTLPPSHVSKALNEIINLGKIDAALAAAARRVRSAKAAVDVSEERLRVSDAERDRLRYAVEMAADVDKLTSVIVRCRAIERRSSRINDLVGGIRRAYLDRDRASGVAKMGVSCEVLALAARKAALRAARLHELAAGVRGALADARRPTPRLDRLAELHAAARTTRSRASRLQSLIFGLHNAQWEIDQCQSQIEKLNARLKSLGRRCPQCGQLVPRR